MKRKLVVIGLLVFISVMHVGFAQGEYKQFIQISFFLKTYGDELVTNVDFYFDMSSIPVNLSLPAFDQLNWAEYTAKPWLNQKVIMNLALRYSEEVDESRANEGMPEFLRVFNHSSLQLLSGPTNETMEFTYIFGYLDDNLENMKNFLRFKPSTGFGSLVDKFLELYVPGGGNTGMYAYYALTKSEQGYLWKLRILASGPENIHFGSQPVNKTKELKKILNSEGPIVASDESAIAIKVTENETTSYKLFTIRVTSTSPPPNYTEIDTSYERSRYFWELNPNQQLDNVVIDLLLDMTSNRNNNLNLPIGTLIIIVAAVVVITSALLLKHIRKRQKKMELKPLEEYLLEKKAKELILNINLYLFFKIFFLFPFLFFLNYTFSPRPVFLIKDRNLVTFRAFLRVSCQNKINARICCAFQSVILQFLLLNRLQAPLFQA